MNFEPPVGFCLVCEKENMKIYCARSKNGKEIVCSRGHVYKNDIDFNRGITKQERKKIDREDKKVMDKVMGAMKEPMLGETVPAIEAVKSTDITISEIDKARLTTLLGEFNDASSLIGLVFALAEEKKELKDTMKRAKRLKVDEADGKVLVSGDLEIQVFVPERHVEPIRDMAHTWNRSIAEYVNERLTILLDDMMLY